MVIDYEQELSSVQAITATAASTNVFDMKANKDIAKGSVLGAVARVIQAFNTLTSLDISIEGCDDAAGTNPVTLITKNFLLAALTANTLLPYPSIPPGVTTAKRFLRAKYTVNGTNPTTGTITFALVAHPQTTKPANDGRTA